MESGADSEIDVSGGEGGGGGGGRVFDFVAGSVHAVSPVSGSKTNERPGKMCACAYAYETKPHQHTYKMSRQKLTARIPERSSMHHGS